MSERGEADPAPAAIEVRDLVKRFEGRAALDGVTLRVREGEIVALLGPNGAGKSTLLRVLAGMTVPDAGVALVGDSDVVRDRRRAAALTGAVTATEHTWSPRLTGQQNLEFVAGGFVVRTEDPRSAASAALEAVGLGEQAHKPVGAYSRGMRARLAIARARLGDPPVLLLDEPTANLDAYSAVELVEGLKQDRRRQAVLISTHSPSEAAVLADRALVLDRGRVSQRLDGPLDAEDIVRALAQRRS